MSTFLSIVTITLTIHLHVTKGIDWTVDQKVFTYGQNLTLFCNIGNCCFYPASWDKWDSKELIPIYIDVRDLKDDVDSNDKYGGRVNKSGFFLTIRDLQEVDLNTEYSCSYDFDVSEKKLLQKTDAFKGSDWMVDHKVSSYGQDLTLFCYVGNCCYYQRRWSKWNTGSQFMPQYINENNGVSSKYNEKLNKSGFFITIRNLEEDDLNKEYACVYDNRPGKRKYLRKSDAFYKEINLDESNEHKEKASSGLNLSTSLLIIVAVLVITIFICGAIVIIDKYCQRQHTDRSIKEVPNSPRNIPRENTMNGHDILASDRLLQSGSIDVFHSSGNSETIGESIHTLDNTETMQLPCDHTEQTYLSYHSGPSTPNVIPKSDPYLDRTSSDRYINRNRERLQALGSRLSSSNVSFTNNKPAVIPIENDSSNCSSGVVNTEPHNYHQYQTHVSDSSFHSSMSAS